MSIQLLRFKSSYLGVAAGWLPRSILTEVSSTP